MPHETRHFVTHPRRRCLVFAAASAWLAGCATPPAHVRLADADGHAPTQAPVRPPTSEEAYRWANRVSWGANDGEVERVQRFGVQAYLAAQLHPNIGQPMLPATQMQVDAMRVHTTPLLALVQALEAQRKAGDALPNEEARKAAQQAYQQALTALARESASRHLLRALYSPNQLLERMTWFWFNHFNVHQYKSNLRALLGDYEERALRPHALGRFRTILGAATRHPAMLRYLDNEANAANRINENHARELLELHTMGVDSGYTQRDVQELARVLTGHGVNFSDNTPNVRKDWAALYVRDGGYEFNPTRHDMGDKTVLNRVVRGRGAAELDEVLDVLAMHPATAQFVSTQLARHFLADEPPPSVVQSMVQAWQRSQGDMAQVMGALFHAPVFAAADTHKFKDPMRYVVSAVRASYPDKAVLNTTPMQNWLNRLGQGLYNRQTPDGYSPLAQAWSSSGQLSVRFEVAKALGSSNAGLFKTEDAAPREVPAFPQLARPVYFQAVRPLMSAATRQALDTAPTPQDWNTLYLAAPEFMYS